MRVFVTGADGFVGQRLAPELKAAGHTVIGSDRNTVDVLDGKSLEKALASARPDAVIHLAAISFVPEASQEPDLAWRINVDGAANLVRAMAVRTPTARLLLIGSGEQYASTDVDAPPVNEDAPLDGTGIYAESKTAAEKLALEAVDRGLDLVRVRAFNHTGPGQSPRFVAPDFSRQIAMIEKGAPAEMHVGNLESSRDFLHVDEVVDAYCRLLDPAVPAGVYNVASGRGTTIRELLATLIGLAGLDVEIQRDPARWREADSRVGDAARLSQTTGWKPSRSIEAILSELLDYWRQETAAGAVERPG